MKNYFLRAVKPELWITIIFVLIISVIAVIIVIDFMHKKRIDKTLNEAKSIITEVALSLTPENMTHAIMVSPQFLAKKSEGITNITIHPDHNIDIYFNKSFIDKDELIFVFQFDTVDSLARGNLWCKEGSVSSQILPNQCRK